ncbi:MAG: hypothetical protein ACJ790_15010 [Myxococcaceae bacterium]
MLLWTAVSFLLCAWMPLVNRSKTGDMTDWFNDHVHHPFATWVALHKGTQIYTRPFAEIWDDSGYPHELKVWGEMPMAYPPGVFALFLPTTLIGAWVPMSDHAFGVLNELLMILLGHLAFLAVLLALKELPVGSRAVVGLFAWMTILTLALNGFFDPVFIGAGAMMVRSIARKEHSRALVWLGVGALLHFRMAAFAPFGLYALVQLIRERKQQPLPWKSLAFLAVAGLVCVWSFWMMYLATAAFRAGHPPVLAGFGKTMVIVYSLVAAGAVFWFADVWVALAVLLCLLLALVETQNYFWHGAIMLAPLLAVGAVKAGRRPSIARAVLIAWAVALGPLVWNDSMVNLLAAFPKYFKV